MPVSEDVAVQRKVRRNGLQGDRTRYTIRQSGKASSSVWIRIPE